MSPEDLQAIAYFWTEKGDLSRWTDWEQKRHEIQREYPELIFAWDNYVTARRLLGHVVYQITKDRQ